MEMSATQVGSIDQCSALNITDENAVSRAFELRNECEDTPQGYTPPPPEPDTDEPPPTGCEPPAVKKVFLSSQTLESRIAMFGWRRVEGATSYTVQVIEINPLQPGSWRLKTLASG